MSTKQAPDALSCTLTQTELIERVQAWKALALRSTARTLGPGTIKSSYPRTSEIETELNALVEAEAECCSFLRFDVQITPRTIEVALSFPPEFQPAIERMLA